MFGTGTPTYRFNLQDRSAASNAVLFTPQSEGLYTPFFFVMAERGEHGQIYYGGGQELVPILGEATFDEAGPFFNVSNGFAQAAMAGTGVNVMPLRDPTAARATGGLFLEVIEQQVTQYVKLPSGKRQVNSGGNFVPKTQSDGVTVVKEAGVSLKWVWRALTSGEDFDALVPTTVTSGGVTTTTYPIVGLEMKSAGSYGNLQGLKLFSTIDTSGSVARAIGSALYQFTPVELPRRLSTTAQILPNNLGGKVTEVAFKPVAVYDATATNYSFDYVLGESFGDTDAGAHLLPYNLSIYSQHVKTIGDLIIAKSPELDVESGYEVDLIGVTDSDGFLLDHVALHPDSALVVGDDVINYASGGTDGDTSWVKFEALVADWLAGSDHGEFENVLQHPITHFTDPGFSLQTKYLLFNMLGMRDNLKIDVSTQDSSLPPNTKAEDLAIGQALMARAQMYPESAINGVGCLRVGIYAHTADLVNASPYGKPVPFTFNRMIQRRDLDGGSYIKGASGGFPASQVTLFKKPNWVADDKTSQDQSWATCINTVRHADRVAIFYPALRTVYPNDTSLLSDDEVSDRLIYIYKICRRVWARFVGVREELLDLFPKIQREIDIECQEAFSNDNIQVKATIFQTAQDANLGTEVSANIDVTGTPTLRSMNFNVVMGRR